MSLGEFMVEKICLCCGKKFEIKNSLKEIRKFCSRSCSSKINYEKNLKNCSQEHKKGNIYRKGKVPQNAFKKGHVPFNKGTKGVMKANKTSFKKGHSNNKKLEIGTIVIRNDKNKKLRKYIKTENNKWILLYKYNWIKEYGEIPKGYILHHKDKNTLNDEIKNLELLTRKQHINIHREDLKTNDKDRKETTYVSD